MSDVLNRLLIRFSKPEEGQGLVEYSLILVLVSLVAIAALQLLGTNASIVFNSAATILSTP